MSDFRNRRARIAYLGLEVGYLFHESIPLVSIPFLLDPVLESTKHEH